MITELLPRLFKEMGLETDHRFKKWAKFVDRVDETHANGFAFVGSFISDGTIELRNSNPVVILAAAVTGSNRYQTTTYLVGVLYPDGTVKPTDIGTTDAKSGWALRIRNDVKTLIASLT